MRVILIFILIVSILVAGCVRNENISVSNLAESNDRSYGFGNDTPGEAHNYFLEILMNHCDNVGISHFLDKNNDLQLSIVVADFDSIFIDSAYLGYGIDSTYAMQMLNVMHGLIDSLGVITSTSADSVFLPNENVWDNFDSFVNSQPVSETDKAIYTQFVTNVKQKPDSTHFFIHENVKTYYGINNNIYTVFDIFDYSLSFWNSRNARDMADVGQGCADAAGGILGGFIGPFSAVVFGIFCSYYCGLWYESLR